MLYLFTFIFLSVGMILLLPTEKKKAIFSFTSVSAEMKRKKINNEKKLTRTEEIRAKIEVMLKRLNKDMNYFYGLTGLCFILGFVVGLICFKTIVLSLASAITFSPLSYLVLVLKTQEKTREELAELQNAMSIITNAYLSSGDLLKSVETYTKGKRKFLTMEENQLMKATPFEEFVTNCVYATSNIEYALDILALQINNTYFNQWIKNLKLCMQNQDMKFSLQPVIKQMADEKILQMESDGVMRKTWQTYFTMMGMMFSVILIFRIMQKEWYDILVGTFVGQVIVILMLVSAIISAIFVTKISKPLSDV